ncbi:DUF5680 domain-containing protein [Natrarchaeobius sp. A-rgal3]|uniref:DUF5680 domain-containing protein n=1 Tax=Natrarchaeobius versutus TaxID=1679078 RepID=UPI00350FE97A
MADEIGGKRTGIEALRAFVVRAHRNGYATGDAERDAEELGKRLEYSDGEFRYVDRYSGSRSFVGHETVFRDGEPVWGMHYHGRPRVEGVDHEPIYAFLRRALAADSATSPFRGPPTFEDERFRYATEVRGDLARFSGTERIECLENGETVYRGRFGGCLLE